MAKLTKKTRMIRDKINVNLRKQYEINEALTLLKESAVAKFIESIDVAIKLGIDARQSEHNMRGAVILPHGTGRKTRIAVFAQGIHAEAAKMAGAHLVGMDDLSNQIKNGNLDFDVVIASPDAMKIVGQVDKILGPRGLMPNSKIGTITSNVSETIKNIKLGQISYRNDKNGIIHTVIGQANFESNQLKENLECLLISLKKNKPKNSKGIFFKKISLSTTMGIGIEIDKNTLAA